jgi:hypothetical protein
MREIMAGITRSAWNSGSRISIKLMLGVEPPGVGPLEVGLLRQALFDLYFLRARRERSLQDLLQITVALSFRTFLFIAESC